MNLIGLNPNTTYKCRLPETFSRYQPRSSAGLIGSDDR